MIMRFHILRSSTRLKILIAVIGLSAALTPLSAQKPTKPEPAKEDIYVKQVAVPSLHGLTHDQAAESLATAGLRPNFEGEADGIVARQLPEAGKTVPLGSSILVVFVASALPPLQMVLVPDVIKRNRDDAATILGRSGLAIGRIEGSEKGIVGHQFPTPKSSVPQGSTVTLQMVTPPAPIPRPVPPPPRGFWTSLGDIISRNPIASLIALACLCAATWGIGKAFTPAPPPVCTLRTARAHTIVQSRGPGHADVTLRMDLVHRSSASYRAPDVAAMTSIRRGSL